MASERVSGQQHRGVLLTRLIIMTAAVRVISFLRNNHRQWAAVEKHSDLIRDLLRLPNGVQISIGVMISITLMRKSTPTTRSHCALW